MMRNTPATDMRASPEGSGCRAGRFVRDASPPRDQGDYCHAGHDALRDSEVNQPDPPDELGPDDYRAEDGGDEDEGYANEAGQENPGLGPVPAPRQHGDGQGEEANHGCHEAVAELDQGGALEHGDDPAVAEGPVGAAEAGAGDPDDPAEGNLDDGNYQGRQSQVDEGPVDGKAVVHAGMLPITPPRLRQISQTKRSTGASGGQRADGAYCL